MTTNIETFVLAALKSAATTALMLGLALVTTYAGIDKERPDRRPQKSLNDIKHIIIIYQENWSFDSLYGQFPGADGYANGFDALPQLDRFASLPYSTLIYQTPSPLTGFPLAIDPKFPSVGGKLGWPVQKPKLALPLIPYDFTTYIPADSVTGDIVHRFYHEQLQIDNSFLEPKLGNLDKFVTWSDNPGLVLSVPSLK